MTDGDFEWDIDRLKALAEAGDTDTQLRLGICYEVGQGTRQDWTQAAYWYGKAAELGLPQAQFKLGILYEKGLGVKRNRDRSVYWHHKAAEQGEVHAQTYLGYYYEISREARQERAQAVYWFGKAAERGHAQAQFKLGHCYEKGIGTQQDWEQAVYWYGKAAEQGYIDAQNKLNECRSENTSKEEKERKEDKPVSPFVLILQIIIFAFGAVAPFVYPEVMDLTPVCQLIIACLYGFAVVIAIVFDRISKQARSVMLWLYFITRAASIAFGFLILGGEPRFAVIAFPFIFWMLILWVETCKDNWQNW